VLNTYSDWRITLVVNLCWNQYRVTYIQAPSPSSRK
jgi:hypothetical protein